MCGITGFLDSSDAAAALEANAVVMRDTLGHRGPDDVGAWVGPCGGLGFRRLAILDLSPAGSQPMESADGGLVLVFNGEIYNFRSLKSDLEAEGVRFRGTSDTEVLVEGLARWRVRKTLERVNGMFAFAVWHRDTSRLTLARDRLGEKPLYYGWQGDTFLFGSELKALRAHPQFAPQVDREAVALFLRYGCVPGPRSIYEGVRKLPPGTFVEIDPAAPGVLPDPVAYWSLADVVARRDVGDLSGAAVDELDALLRDSVGMRMIADVPLGALLSGGVDSSTVVAMMQAQASGPVRTFAIGFGEGDYDESAHAAAVARHLGTDHTELHVSAEDALAVIPRLPELYDEPFADSSQIPTFLVSQLARQHVTVALTGDGADEVFGGYARYQAGEGMTAALGRLPRPALRLVTAGIEAVPAGGWQVLDRWFSRPGEKAQKLAASLSGAAGPDALTWLWPDAASLVLGVSELDGTIDVPAGLSGAERMMYADTMRYLPDDILVKVDRASMAVSLEGRMPFLDHRVVEFAWSLPPAMRRRKAILRQVLDRYVPTELVDRPKMGFGVPVGEWLRGPLRDWGEELVSETRLRNDGHLAVDPVRAAWLAHQERKADHGHRLWAVLMFQAWLDSVTPGRTR